MFKTDYNIHSNLIGLLEELLSEYKTYLEDYYQINMTKDRLTSCRNAVGCFLYNSYPSYKQNKDYCYISLNKNEFNKGTIINGRRSRRKVSYKYFKMFIEFLDFYDYILTSKGSVDKYTYVNGYYEILESHTTKLYYQDKLKESFASVPPFTQQIVDVIKLKDRSKNLLTFNSDAKIRETKDYLNRFNVRSIENSVTCHNKKYDIQSYKIFNNSSFQQGGRTFMSNSIQSLSKQDRLDTLINGKPVCMFDYKGFEPSITYSLSEAVMPSIDPYEISMPNYDTKILRKLSKVALLIMLNAENEDEARNAFNYAVFKDFKPKVLYQEGKIPAEMVHTKIIMEKLMDKHEAIIDRFFKGLDGEIMYYGSLINDYVVSYMMQNYNVLVIQTHDEFMCDLEYADELEECMLSGWEFVLGTKNNCTIVREQ